MNKKHTASALPGDADQAASVLAPFANLRVADIRSAMVALQRIAPADWPVDLCPDRPVNRSDKP